MLVPSLSQRRCPHRWEPRFQEGRQGPTRSQRTVQDDHAVADAGERVLGRTHNMPLALLQILRLHPPSSNLDRSSFRFLRLNPQLRCSPRGRLCRQVRLPSHLRNRLWSHRRCHHRYHHDERQRIQCAMVNKALER